MLIANEGGLSPLHDTRSWYAKQAPSGIVVSGLLAYNRQLSRLVPSKIRISPPIQKYFKNIFSHKKLIINFLA